MAVSSVMAPRESNLPRSWRYDAEAGAVTRDLDFRALQEALARGAPLWVDIDSTNRHQMALLEKVFRFHPLAIEDALNPNSRVKVDDYDGHLFAIVRGVRFHEATDDPYDLDTYNVCFFLGRSFLVTTHGQPVPAIDGFAQRCDGAPEVLGRGLGRVMHQIMDGVVDQYFPILDQLDEFVDGLEERVFGRFDRAVLRDIFSVKRTVLSLRRHLAPQREVFNALTNRPQPFLPPEVQVYFRDVYDHVLRINDSLETYRDMLGSTLDSYLTQTSNQLGQVTKALTVVGAASVPFVVVSGMWGMNFDAVPFAAVPHGFWWMLAFQLALGVGLLALLRARGML